METGQALFFLHLLQFPRRYESEMMSRLKARGHAELRLSFAPVISALARTDMRLTDLADSLEMQKQNCMQLLNRIEQAGFIRRVADPGDGRSRLVQLTGEGEQLVSDGVEVVSQIDDEFRELIGTKAFARFQQALNKLCAKLDAGERGGNVVLIVNISWLASHAGKALNALVRARGHTHIRPVHEKVLLHVGEGRTRIQDIASENDVSRQAISAIVNELQDLDYIRLDADPADRRGKRVRLTEKGQDFTRDSTQASAELAQQFQQLLGEADFREMAKALASIYQALCGASNSTQGGKALTEAARDFHTCLTGSGAAHASTVLSNEDLETLKILLSRLQSAQAEAVFKV